MPTNLVGLKKIPMNSHRIRINVKWVIIQFT